jgi:hypothetical protein
LASCLRDFVVHLSPTIPVADVADVELFDLGAGPGGFAQEDEARFYAGVVGEAADRDHPAELFPAVVLGQGGDDVLERLAVQRVAVGLVHERERGSSE